MNQNININDLISKLLEATDTKSIKIKTAKTLFFNCLKTNNADNDTINYYKNIFYRIDRFFSTNNIDETSQINDKILMEFITDCMKDNLSANYINKLVGAIKYMIRTLAKFGYIDYVEFKIKKLKEVENRINSIEQTTLSKILNFVATQDYKTKSIVYLLLATGVRRKELANIKLENLDFNKNSITLETTKTKVIRTCFFTNEVKDILKIYLRDFKPKTYLFEGSMPGKAIPPRNISKVLEKIKVCLEIDSLSAHQFRHTFGTCIFNASLDIELTRELLGHSSYNMTRRYIHNSKERLREKYDLYNPLSITK